MRLNGSSAPANCMFCLCVNGYPPSRFLCAGVIDRLRSTCKRCLTSATAMAATTTSITRNRPSQHSQRTTPHGLRRCSKLPGSVSGLTLRFAASRPVNSSPTTVFHHHPLHLLMKPQDHLQDCRRFSLSHQMGEGRGERPFAFCAASPTPS